MNAIIVRPRRTSRLDLEKNAASGTRPAGGTDPAGRRVRRYKVAGSAGAVIGSAAAFLPSFVMMLAILPALDRVRKLVWTRAALRGIAPAVIGMLAVSLVRLAPYALPDVFAIATLVATVVLLLVWRVATLKIMLLGPSSALRGAGFFSLSGAKAVLSTVTRA